VFDLIDEKGLSLYNKNNLLVVTTSRVAPTALLIHAGRNDPKISR
jgi:hypothetical protein